MSSFIDYIYFRVKRKFYKKDSDGIFATCMISAIQLLLVVDVLMLTSKLFLDRGETAPYAKLIAQIGGVVFIAIVIINFRKYHKRYWVLSEHWKNESTTDRTRRGWFVFISILLPFLILILIGIVL